MEPILQQSFTIKELISNPYFWGSLSLFSYIVGGTLFRNFVVRKLTRDYYTKYNHSYNRSIDLGAQPYIDNSVYDKDLVQIARVFFPLSAIIYIVVAVIVGVVAFVGNTLSSKDKMDNIARKELSRLYNLRKNGVKP